MLLRCASIADRLICRQLLVSLWFAAQPQPSAPPIPPSGFAQSLPLPPPPPSGVFDSPPFVEARAIELDVFLAGVFCAATRARRRSAVGSLSRACVCLHHAFNPLGLGLADRQPTPTLTWSVALYECMCV